MEQETQGLPDSRVWDNRANFAPGPSFGSGLNVNQQNVISAVERAGLSDLREGAKISYDVVPNKGKESAENLKVQ
jgi:hypothetical protein